jgi:hypothetical protein
MEEADTERGLRMPYATVLVRTKIEAARQLSGASSPPARRDQSVRELSHRQKKAGLL